MSNHSLYFDPGVVAHAIVPRRTLFSALESTVQAAPFLGNFIRFLGAFPIPERMSLVRLARPVRDALARGWLVHFFPERDLKFQNRSLQPFHPGVFFLAHLFDVPVVPVTLVIRHPRLFGRRVSRLLVRVTVVIDRPLYPAEFGGNGQGRKEAAERMAAAVRARMQDRIDRYGGPRRIECSITLTYAFLAYASIVFLLNLWYFRRRRPRPVKGEPERISVLVPARNEEANLPRCLDSLLAQSYPNLEILVMDDDSTDGTWALLQDYAARFPGRIRVFRNDRLPAGWVGKCWVCSRLAELADGRWLAFVDADTFHKPDCIARAYEEARRRDSSLVSYMPDWSWAVWPRRSGCRSSPSPSTFCFPSASVRWLKSRYAAMAVGTFHAGAPLDLRALRGARGAAAATSSRTWPWPARSRPWASASTCWTAPGLSTPASTTTRARSGTGSRRPPSGPSASPFCPIVATLFFAYALFLNPFLMLAMHPALSFYNPFFNQVLAILALRLLLALRVRQTLLTVILHPVMIVFALLFCLNSLWRIAWGLPISWKQRAYKISK